MNTNPIAQTLASLVLGRELVVENLTMLPLIGTPPKSAPIGTRQHPSAPVSLDYIVLDDALASGVVEITEVSEQGSVPDLRIINKGASPVLIVDGEELVGAKQNRVVNLTILVPGHSELTIPVSCVEAGRWRARSRAFSAAPRAQYATGRAKRMKQVTESLCFSGQPMSDQADVWADIAQKSARMSVNSPTSAMEALFVGHAGAIDVFVRACSPVEDQYGALFAVNGTFVGGDIFDRPSTLRRVLPKLVRSVAVDALDELGTGTSCGGTTSNKAAPSLAALRTSCEQFLAVVSAAPRRSAKAVGLGDDVRITAQGLVGAALVAEGSVIHLSAFAIAA